jgi:hypothetical protein
VEAESLAAEQKAINEWVVFIVHILDID